MANANGHRPVAPIEYPPPVDPAAEFIAPPTDPEDERIEVGVAIVGGGQAGMACAIRLLQLLEDDPALAESLGEVPVAVIEKGRVAGEADPAAVPQPRQLRRLGRRAEPLAGREGGGGRRVRAGGDRGREAPG